MVILAALAASLLITACGGGDQTSQAAMCLRNALAETSSENNCADPTAYNVMKDISGSFSVSCTHENGNDYVCDVTGEATQGQAAVAGGFYSVVYDGKSITFQRTS